MPTLKKPLTIARIGALAGAFIAIQEFALAIVVPGAEEKILPKIDAMLRDHAATPHLGSPSIREFEALGALIESRFDSIDRRLDSLTR